MDRADDRISDNIEVVPVVVVSQTFPARPSSIPDIRDFVRRCLAQSPLSEEDTREVGVTVIVGGVSLLIGYSAEQIAHAQEVKDAIDAGEL